MNEQEQITEFVNELNKLCAKYNIELYAGQAEEEGDLVLVCNSDKQYKLNKYEHRNRDYYWLT